METSHSGFIYGINHIYVHLIPFHSILNINITHLCGENLIGDDEYRCTDE